MRKEICFGMLACASACYAQNANKPNIIVILADDMGYGDVSALNKEAKVTTPNLNSLVETGLNLSNAHSNSAVSTPTRYGIMTGRYCFRTRLKNGVLYGYDEPLIERGRATLASMLKSNGYFTGMSGKWHLGLNFQPKDKSKPVYVKDKNFKKARFSNVDFTKRVNGGPADLGFDYSFVFPASLDMSPYCYIENGNVVDPDMELYRGISGKRGAVARAGEKSKSLVVEHALIDIVDKGCEFISKNAKRNDKKPFFLYLPLTAPHTPWVPTQEYRGKSGAGDYGDFVMMVDDMVGRVISTLKQKGIYDNTLIVFTSDNGSHWKPEDIKLHGHKANYDRRGMKSDAWDGGHRVPFIVHWGNRIKKARSVNNLVCTTDMFATFADIVGYSPKMTEAEDSYSFYSLISKKDSKIALRKNVIHHSIDGTFAIREGKWKLIDAAHSGGWSLRINQVKPDMPKQQLYDMENDIKEQNNLIEKNLEIARELYKKLKEYRDNDNSRF